jgi:hypothetical protein
MNDEERDQMTIERCANGWLVTGSYRFQTGRPSNGPIDWHVFETFDGLVEHLAKRWPPKVPA